MPVEIYKDKFTGKVLEVILGATKEQGGTRAYTVKLGGSLATKAITPMPTAMHILIRLAVLPCFAAGSDTSDRALFPGALLAGLFAARHAQRIRKKSTMREKRHVKKKSWLFSALSKTRAQPRKPTPK